MEHWWNYCKSCEIEVVLSQNMVNPNSEFLKEEKGLLSSTDAMLLMWNWFFCNSIEIRNCNPLVLLWTFAPLHHESGARVRGVIYNANTISSRQCVQTVSCHQAHTSCYKVRAMHKLHDHFLLLSPLLVPKLQPHAFWEPLTAKKNRKWLKIPSGISSGVWRVTCHVIYVRPLICEVRQVVISNSLMSGNWCA